MQEGMTPEEKLLKHIRKPRRPFSSAKKSTKGDKVSKLSNISKIREKKILPVFNTLLVFASIGLAGLSAYQFFFIERDINILRYDVDTTQKNNTKAEIILPEVKPYSVYAKQISKRDIFESPLQMQKRTTRKFASTSSAPELTRNLRLVGIILDDTKEAVIEDLEEKNTLFLHEGESIKGAIIEEILESKVILIYQDKKVELTQ